MRAFLILGMFTDMADLVLLDANPLANIGNASRIQGVMLRGRWLDREDLDEILAKFERL